MRLAVIILTRNEERNIRECIKSAGFADEIIVVDSGSDDNTCQIAQGMGAEVYQHPMDADGFAGQRNFALEQTTADWVLYLDADERITPELATEIRQHMERRKEQAAKIKRINVVMGQRMYHGVYRPDYIVRLFPSEKVHWEGVVHEQAVIDLPIIKLQAPAYHYCLIDWNQYFNKFNQYTTLMAEKMYKRKKKTNIIAMHVHALFAFFQMYIIKRGFLDGKLGFILCQYHYYYTLTKYVKLQFLNKREMELEDEK